MQSATSIQRNFASAGSAWLRSAVNAALELVLPCRCVACAEPVGHGAMCDPCAATLLPVHAPCERCGRPGSAPRCRWCSDRRDPAPVTARAPWLYGGALRRAVVQLKFGDAAHLARPLGESLVRPFAAELVSALAIDLVIPVPLHRRRLRRRGFNQAALLARAATRGLEGTSLDCAALGRVRDTPPQSGLSRHERLRNVEGAFVARPKRVAGRRVLLVDDVLTTGATVRACATALHAAGAAEIHVLTLALAMP